MDKEKILEINNLKISFWTLAREFVIVCNDIGNRLENFGYWITSIRSSAVLQSCFIFLVLVYQGSNIYIKRSVFPSRQ